MRALLFLGFFLLAGLWLLPRSVGADAGNAAEKAEKAEMLENSLQAVEWYTNESVHKALQAERAGDLVNASLFGNKAIESDLKAQGLRNETATAWKAAGRPERAQAAWHRAAEMARARAGMLAGRIPQLLTQWQSARGGQPLPDKAVSEQEAEILYLEALMYTAEQWELVAEFSRSAAETSKSQAAVKELQKLLSPLRENNRLVALSSDKRLATGPEKLQRWERMVAATK